MESFHQEVPRSSLAYWICARARPSACFKDSISKLHLGYDPTTNDYKVLVFIRKSLFRDIFAKDLPTYARNFFYKNNEDVRDDTKVTYYPPASIEVYTLNTGIWRTISSVEGNDNYGKNAPFWWDLSHTKCLNGVIHWIDINPNISNDFVNYKSTRIVSFDVSSEVCNRITKIPTYLSLAMTRDYNLGVVGNSLAFMFLDTGRVSIWLMNESERSATADQHSWYKVCVMDVSVAGNLTLGFPADLITKSEEVLVFTSCGLLVSYDIKSQ